MTDLLLQVIICETNVAQREIQPMFTITLNQTLSSSSRTNSPETLGPVHVPNPSRQTSARRCLSDHRSRPERYTFAYRSTAAASGRWREPQMKAAEHNTDSVVSASQLTRENVGGNQHVYIYITKYKHKHTYYIHTYIHTYIHIYI